VPLYQGVASVASRESVVCLNLMPDIVAKSPSQELNQSTFLTSTIFILVTPFSMRAEKYRALYNNGNAAVRNALDAGF